MMSGGPVGNDLFSTPPPESSLDATALPGGTPPSSDPRGSMLDRQKQLAQERARQRLAGGMGVPPPANGGGALRGRAAPSLSAPRVADPLEPVSSVFDRESYPAVGTLRELGVSGCGVAAAPSGTFDGVGGRARPPSSPSTTTMGYGGASGGDSGSGSGSSRSAALAEVLRERERRRVVGPADSAEQSDRPSSARSDVSGALSTASNSGYSGGGAGVGAGVGARGFTDRADGSNGGGNGLKTVSSRELQQQHQHQQSSRGLGTVAGGAAAADGHAAAALGRGAGSAAQSAVGGDGRGGSRVGAPLPPRGGSGVFADVARLPLQQQVASAPSSSSSSSSNAAAGGTGGGGWGYMSGGAATVTGASTASGDASYSGVDTARSTAISNSRDGGGAAAGGSSASYDDHGMMVIAPLGGGGLGAGVSSRHAGAAPTEEVDAALLVTNMRRFLTTPVPKSAGVVQVRGGVGGVLTGLECSSVEFERGICKGPLLQSTQLVTPRAPPSTAVLH